MKVLATRCGKMNCPSVHEMENGDLLIRGADAHLTLATWELPGGDGPPEGERDIIISRALVEAALKNSQ